MKRYTIPFFLLGSLVMVYVMAKTGAPLKTAATPLGILDLEFAYNSTKATSVIDAWTTSKNIRVAINNTWLDFIFLFFYAVFLFTACKKIAQSIKGPVGRAGNLIAVAALAAGFLDVLENLGMLISLSGQVSAAITFLTTFFSVIKWVLALFAVLYVLTGTIVWGYRKFIY